MRIKRSYDNTSENAQLAGLSSQRMLLWQLDIKNFFVTELPQLLHQLTNHGQILCTMDICGFLKDLSYETGRQAYYTNPVHIKMGTISEVIARTTAIFLSCTIS